MSISFNEKCKKNSDCQSNVCELIYENGEPKGRFCLVDDKKYTKSCTWDKDCNSGKCQQIYDNNGRFLTKKCVKEPKLDRDGPYNSLFGKDRAKSNHGLISNRAIQNDVMLKMGEEGPIAEVIIMVLNLIFDLFGIIVYDPKKDADDENQGLLFSIWYSIFDSIFGGFTKDAKHGLFWGGIQKNSIDPATGKCYNDSKSVDLWYFRTALTILCPPFGVFLAKGIKGLAYVILSCLLTFLGYFPGLIYSFAVINSSDAEFNELHQIKKFK
tara:strand:+ start:117 stop:923 length:807 start_codon:yes stop_codon:yes gene_type:complete